MINKTKKKKSITTEDEIYFVAQFTSSGTGINIKVLKTPNIAMFVSTNIYFRLILAL